jgi:hypothetical protein
MGAGVEEKIPKFFGFSSREGDSRHRSVTQNTDRGDAEHRQRERGAPKLSSLAGTHSPDLSTSGVMTRTITLEPLPPRPQVLPDSTTRNQFEASSPLVAGRR